MGIIDKVKLLVDAPLNNDVTTTPDDPPQFRACAELPANDGRDMSYRSRNILLDDAPLDPLAIGLEPGQLFARVLRIAEERQNWDIVSADRGAGRIEVVATTSVLRFKDDVVIEIREGEVHMRSKSRLGRKDFGANEDRIRAFLADLRSALDLA